MKEPRDIKIDVHPAMILLALLWILHWTGCY